MVEHILLIMADSIQEDLVTFMYFPILKSFKK